MTPTTAEPTSTVTVTGTLVNRTGTALPGIVVQAWTSTGWFKYPEQMTEFTGDTASGASPLPLQQAGQQYPVPGTVANGATASWSVSFPAGLFYSQFGVFPVQVQALAAGTADTATARTFLPFWPGSQAASQSGSLQVSWIWPLIDTPQQGACPRTLATNELAGSLASGGRLSTLLSAGSMSQGDDLTWDIDPALLSDVSVMTRSYFTNGSAICSGRFLKKADPAASKWLSQLQASTAGASAFLTPYADVDAAALSHAGLDSSLKTAYHLGDTVAGRILPNTFGRTGTGTGDGQVLKAAYPADGLADAEVLTNLADNGINTVVLSSKEVTPTSPGGGEDALARTISGVGTNVSLLAANSRITSLLGTASASATPAAQFTLTQDFLAQTAMIAAETDTERSLVVAPPANWDPSPAEANALLKITHDAQWLHPTGLSKLAAAAAKLPSVTQLQPKQVSGAELTNAYLDKISAIGANVSLFENLLYKPSAGQIDSLDAALAAAESSAWRGSSGSPGGWRAVSQLNVYLNDEEHKVQLVASKKILLFGQSGETAVSVQNGLDQAIQVKVTASSLGGSLQVGSFNPVITVQAHGSNTVHMPLRSSAIGTTTIQLRLATPDGTMLNWKQAGQLLSVEVTRYGRSLLIIIGAALAILVLTSAYRLRRKRLAGTKSEGSADEMAKAGGTG